MIPVRHSNITTPLRGLNVVGATNPDGFAAVGQHSHARPGRKLFSERNALQRKQAEPLRDAYRHLRLFC